MSGNVMRNTPALVLGSQDTIRCLGPYGIEVIVVASNPNHLGFRSRYCKKAVLVKDFVRHSDAVVSELVALGQQFETKPVLLSCGDNDVLLVSRHREQLSKYFHLILPDEALVEDLVDKIRFHKLALIHQIPTPTTFLISSTSELIERSKEIPFPCIIKPACPTRWWTVEFTELFGDRVLEAVKVQNVEDLIDYYGKISALDRDVLIQEYISGRDENLYSFNAYFNKNGEPVAYFTGRKIMNYPIHLGSGCMDEIRHDPEVEALGLEILCKLRFKGVAKIDFKRDSKDGSLKVFEINPRFNFWNYLGAAAGINLPLIAYYDVQGLRTQIGLNGKAIRQGVKWVNFKDTCKAFLEYRAVEEWTFPRWLRAFWGKKVYHVFSWDDPMPLFYSWRIFFRQHVGRTLRN